MTYFLTCQLDGPLASHTTEKEMKIVLFNGMATENGMISLVVPAFNLDACLEKREVCRFVFFYICVCRVRQ